MPCFLKILCALCQGAGAALLDRIRVLQAATPMSLKTLLFMDSKLFLLATARCRVQQLTLRRAKGAWILCEVCVKYKATELKVDFSWHQCPRHACCEHLGTSSFPVALGWHQECCGLRGPRALLPLNQLA